MTPLDPSWALSLRNTALIINKYAISVCSSSVHSLTYRGPGRALPDVIELPVKGTHRMTFAVYDYTATAAVEFCLYLHTLGLHHLCKPAHD